MATSSRFRAYAAAVLLVTIASTAYAKYSGGSGTVDDPYQIATAADLILLGDSPADYDKHFILTADIDLDPSLPGRKVFDKAVIAPDTNPNDEYSQFQGTPFTGVFDGNGHRISRLAITGGAYVGLFGQLGFIAKIRDLGVLGVKIAGSGYFVGGLVGRNGDVPLYPPGGTVTRCYSTGTVSGRARVGGLVGENCGDVIRCYSTSMVSGKDHVGGLVGCNEGWIAGTVSQCYSTGRVSGEVFVGGLVGNNWGAVIGCYSMGAVNGGGSVGGLAGGNWGSVTRCRSTGPVRGNYEVGGLVGRIGGLGEEGGGMDECYSTGVVSGGSAVGGLVGTRGVWATGGFWDTQTSGRSTSDGGTGKTTAEMQTAKTFLDAGWDFVGETANGTEDIWWILERRDYPRLTWEQGEQGEPQRAFAPYPLDGTTDVVRSPVLRWAHGEPLLRHDVYLGDDKEVVANATTKTSDVYCGRYPPEVTTYDTGVLEWSRTYYWRIDEVNEADPNSPWKGTVWSFTTADCVVSIVDDFEGYTGEEGKRIYETWIDGPGPDVNVPGNGTGSTVGYPYQPFAWQMIVHGGKQAIPMDYNNVKTPWYSEAERTWKAPQDWTVGGADTLTLYFRGNPVSFTESDGVIRMSDSGSVNPGGVSLCSFAYKRLNGSGSIVAKVLNTGGMSGRDAKAGVMIRESLDLNDKSPYVVYAPVRDAVLFGSANSLGTGTTVGDTQTLMWVKLTRTGDVFTAQYSPDGKTWTDIRNGNGQIGSMKIAMTSSVYIGLCVTSSDPGLPATAVFSDIGTTGDVTGDWQVAAIGGDWQTRNALQKLYVRIEDIAGKYASVVYPDVEVVLATEWQKWHIALAEVRAAGVDVAAVQKMVIGVGDRNNPKPGGTGRIYIDDIRLTKRMP